uniref:Uncharacterized protein n=1 Tax=Candidatus Methanogaster sp. ANME-2c ERB4 TaxID=2759911 RepID=A0A7G9Y4N3_9EURY|nr:hypothetical protein MNOMIAMN_00007 [Methanosarcinales archaeon ANME-2c ERB4]
MNAKSRVIPTNRVAKVLIQLYSISSYKEYANPKISESLSYPRQNMMPRKLKSAPLAIIYLWRSS